MSNTFLNLKSKYKKGILENDMKYIYSKNNYYKYISIIIFIRCGSKHESKDEEGLAHFLEHILFKGTKKYKTNLILNKRIDELSAQINASTTYNYTNYYITLPSKYLLEGLDLIKEIVFEALLNKEELEKEKKVVLEEINQTIDDSTDYCNDLIISELFKECKNNYNIGHSILGNKKNINSLTRKKLLKFYNKYYKYNNSCVSITGDLPKNILKILNKTFCNINSDINLNNLELKFNKSNIVLKKPKILSKMRKREQIVIGLGFPIFDLYDKRKNELDILVNILYGGMTSKLWLALREINPIVYGLNVSYELLEEGGIFVITLSFEKKKINDTIKYLLKELKDIKKNILNEKDFKRLKDMEINDLIIYNNETLEIADYYGTQLILEEEIESYKSLKNIYQKIHRTDIKRLCNEILDFNNCILLQVGDINNKNIKKLFYENI